MRVKTVIAATIIGVVVGACAQDAFQASTGESPMDYIEMECAKNMLDCELVYQFDSPAPATRGGSSTFLYREMCVRAVDLDFAETLYGSAELSTEARFDQWRALGVEPICWWHCGSATGPGCNSLDGCFACKPSEMH